MSVLGSTGLDPFMGLRVLQVPSWQWHYETHWTPLPLGQLPPGVSGRAASRRRVWAVGKRVKVYEEPTKILRMGGTIYCTAKQYADLKRALKPSVMDLRL
jgi:hypothetical protein